MGNSESSRRGGKKRWSASTLGARWRGKSEEGDQQRLKVHNGTGRKRASLAVEAALAVEKAPPAECVRSMEIRKTVSEAAVTTMAAVRGEERRQHRKVSASAGIRHSTRNRQQRRHHHHQRRSLSPQQKRPTAHPQRQRQGDPEAHSSGGGSLKAARTSTVGFAAETEHESTPDRVEIASLDELYIGARPSSSSTATGAGPLAAPAVRRQRPNTVAFDRRAKSFRHAHHQRTISSAASGLNSMRLCPISGLTLAQKRLILARWRQLHWADMQRLSEHIFERAFRRNEAFARTVLRTSASGAHWWRGQHAFRIHTQRFCNALAELCAGLEDKPDLGAELLAEFGAQHAAGVEIGPSAGAIPPSYWDVLLLAICEAAGATEAQQQHGHPTTNHHTESLSLSSGFCDSSSPSTLVWSNQWTRRSADAWAQFAVFVSAQMRFGYEMERFLRERLRRVQRERERSLGNESIGEEEENGEPQAEGQGEEKENQQQDGQEHKKRETEEAAAGGGESVK